MFDAEGVCRESRRAGMPLPAVHEDSEFKANAQCPNATECVRYRTGAGYPPNFESKNTPTFM
jgi:hypothetical protein